MEIPGRPQVPDFPRGPQGGPDNPVTEQSVDTGGVPPERIDPLERSDIGTAEMTPVDELTPPPSGRGMVPGGGMSTDFDTDRDEGAAAPPETAAAGGDGSIGGGGGIDDAGTHGGGTAVLPNEDEVVKARHEEMEDAA